MPSMTDSDSDSTQQADMPATGKRHSSKRRSAPILANGLTVQQECFAVAVSEGGSYADAYRGCYDCSNSKITTVYRMAYELGQHHKVGERIQQLVRERVRFGQHSPAALRQFVVERLVHEAKNCDAPGPRIKAIELIGKLADVGAFAQAVEDASKTAKSADTLKREIVQRLASLLGEGQAMLDITPADSAKVIDHKAKD
jgi:hypothetical protein